MNCNYDKARRIPLEEAIITNNIMYFSNEQYRNIHQVIPEIKDYYMISNYGNLYNIYLGRLMKPQYTKDNYIRYELVTDYGPKKISAHRLVLSVFYPEKGTLFGDLQVNHKDGVHYNNYISYNDYNRGNIEWCTGAENIQHAYRTGLIPTFYGEDTSYAKISNETAMKIINLLALNKYTNEEIANMVGNGANNRIVKDIRMKKSWNFLSEGINFLPSPKKYFNEDEVHSICKIFERIKYNKMSIADRARLALKELNIDCNDKLISMMYHIYHKTIYVDICKQYDY